MGSNRGKSTLSKIRKGFFFIFENSISSSRSGQKMVIFWVDFQGFQKVSKPGFWPVFALFCHLDFRGGPPVIGIESPKNGRKCVETTQKDLLSHFWGSNWTFGEFRRHNRPNNGLFSRFFTKKVDFSKKNRFYPKKVDFSKNIDFFKKVDFSKKIDFFQKSRFFKKHRFFSKKSIFQKKSISQKKSIFHKKVDFSKKIDFSQKSWIFNSNVHTAGAFLGDSVAVY